MLNLGAPVIDACSSSFGFGALAVKFSWVLALAVLVVRRERDGQCGRICVKCLLGTVPMP